MKKAFSLLLLLATIFTFTSCGDDEDEPDVLTAEQKVALSAMHGTFTNTLPLMDWTTTIEFLERYNPPKDATSSLTGKVPQYIQGKLRITYYEGSSFTYYYRLNSDATRIYMGSNIDKWDNVKSQDFRYVSENEFKIKETNATLWDSYTRK